MGLVATAVSSAARPLCALCSLAFHPPGTSSGWLPSRSAASTCQSPCFVLDRLGSVVQRLLVPGALFRPHLCHLPELNLQLLFPLRHLQASGLLLTDVLFDPPEVSVVWARVFFSLLTSSERLRFSPGEGVYLGPVAAGVLFFLQGELVDGRLGDVDLRLELVL